MEVKEIDTEHFSTESNQSKIRQGFAQYCKETSLHGWHYVQSERNVLMKVMWFLLILLHYVIATVFIWKNFQEYSNGSTLATVQSATASLDEITFPSLYVCNLNQFTRSFLANIDVSEEDEEYAIVLLQRELISGSKTKMTPEEHAFVTKVQEKMAEVYEYHNQSHIFDISNQDCSDMLLKVRWSQRSVKLFYSAVRMSTEYGMCCVITPNLDFKENSSVAPSYSGSQVYNVPRGFAKDGMSRGLQVTLDMELYDHAMILDSIGFKLGLSDIRDKTLIRNHGFSIQPGTLTEVTIIPSITKTTSQAINDFSPEERNCYIDSEFQFKYLVPQDGFRYSMDNCFYEALLQRIVEDCQCVHYLDYKIVTKSHPKLNVCKKEKLYCANNLMSDLGNESLEMNFASDVKGVKKKCLPRCEVQTNDFILSQLLYPHTQTFKFHSDVCLITQKIHNICKNSTKRKVFEKHYKSEMTCHDFELFFDSHFQQCDGETNSQFIHTHKNHTKLFRFLQKYATENIAKVKIFLRDSYYTQIKRDVQLQVSFVEFVSNTGGLLGLYVGLSIISIFELIYHCIKCLYDFHHTRASKKNHLGVKFPGYNPKNLPAALPAMPPQGTK